MASSAINFSDLARPLVDVAGALPEWQRGDHADAAAVTLTAASRTLHERSPTLWVWTAYDDVDEGAWILPVRASQAAEFAPAGPARSLARAIWAAADVGANLDELSLGDWRGHVVLMAPGLDPDLCVDALAGREPDARVSVGALVSPLTGVRPLDLPTDTRRGGNSLGVVALARATHVHPVQVVVTLASHGQEVDRRSYDPALEVSLRLWGCDGDPPPALLHLRDVDNDPCPHRRHARRSMQRLYGMKKIGALYHTDISHFPHGAPPDQRGKAMEIAEALVRAELLGAKRSVGQRHIYLRRDRLPQIHAFIERGATEDQRLAAFWTAPL